MYTERGTEFLELLGKIDSTGAAMTAEGNTSYIATKGHARFLVILQASIVATSIDLDIELATAADGTGGPITMTGKSITQETDDAKVMMIEIRAEEFFQGGVNYTHFRVEVTPSGNCSYSVLVFGIDPYYKPVAVTSIEEIVD